MKKYLLHVAILLAAVLSLPAAAQRRGPVTTGSLYEAMIDLAGLARFPDPAFRMMQFSSYDHRSKYAGGPHWFDNSDGFGGEPVPNFENVLVQPNAEGMGEYLMADVAGPGALVRLWTASISGTVRVFLDDMETPFYEGDADPWFRRPMDIYSQIKEIDRDRFRRIVYQRDASYAPIPFKKHFRIVWIGNIKEIHFYHIQFRLYDKGTEVVSFSPDDLIRFKDTIDRVTLALADPDNSLPVLSKEKEKTFEARLAPGQKKELVLMEGPGALERLVLKLTSANMDPALRQTVLNIKCDDAYWGQVQSPVGDFFGAAPGVNPYQSLPFTVRPDSTMICRYVMPYASNLRIELENRSMSEISVTGAALPMAWTWDDASLHFRARWRADHELIGDPGAVRDLPFLVGVGRGVYVGTVSYVMNTAEPPAPWGNWWGEGDEKVFVDDGSFPSLFGTGSEDYYNYSWSAPDIFSFPYCGQPRNDGTGNRGFVTNYRWHILDPIPFQKNIRFYLELYTHQRSPGMSYARIAYHYARPGLTDDHLPIAPEDLRPLKMPEGWEPAALLGGRNSVFYGAEELMQGKRDTRLMPGNLYQGGRYLVWSPKHSGAVKRFQIPIESEGKKRIYLALVLNPKGGEVDFSLDGKHIRLSGKRESINLQRPYRTLLRNFALEARALKAGTHTLEVRFLESESQPPDIGIDFIWIQNQD